MKPLRIFDAKRYERLNDARRASVLTLLSELKQRLNLRTAIDVGCGLGFFADLLQSLGLDVSAIDGRRENVEEAQRRFPKISFQEMDAQDPGLRELGTFDLVFCFGLLYHLENPMLTVRHLHEMARHVMLVESVTFPGDEPIMALVDEGDTEDQGLNHLAFYPTEACLVKMLYRSGFSNVYGLIVQPDHPEYHEGTGTRRTRTMLAATQRPLQSKLLNALLEPNTPIVPWDPNCGVQQPTKTDKLRRFMSKSLKEKVKSVKKAVEGL